MGLVKQTADQNKGSKSSKAQQPKCEMHPNKENISLLLKFVQSPALCVLSINHVSSVHLSSCVHSVHCPLSCTAVSYCWTQDTVCKKLSAGSKIILKTFHIWDDLDRLALSINLRWKYLIPTFKFNLVFKTFSPQNQRTWLLWLEYPYHTYIFGANFRFTNREVNYNQINKIYQNWTVATGFPQTLNLS